MNASVLILAESGSHASLGDVPDALRRVGIAARLVETEAGSVRIPIEGHKLLEACDRIYIVGEGAALDSARAIATERGALVEGDEGRDTFGHVGAIGEALGRKDLDTFLVASATGPSALAAWKDAHPGDPLAKAGFKMPSLPKLPPLPARTKQAGAAKAGAGSTPASPAPQRPAWGRAFVQGLVLALCHFAAIVVLGALIVLLFDPNHLSNQQAAALALAVLSTPLVLLAGFIATRLRGTLGWRGTAIVEAIAYLLPALLIAVSLSREKEGEAALWVGLAFLLVAAGTFAFRQLVRRLWHRGPKWLAVLPFLAAAAVFWLAIKIDEHIPARDGELVEFLEANAYEFRTEPAVIASNDRVSREGAAWRTASSRAFIGNRYTDRYYVPLSAIDPDMGLALRQAVLARSGRIYLDDAQGYVERQDIEALGDPVLALNFGTEGCADMNPCAIPKSLTLLWPQGQFDGQAETKTLIFSIEASIEALADDWGYDPAATCGFDPRKVPATRLVTDVCWGRVAKLLGRDRQVDPATLLPYAEESLRGIVQHWAAQQGWFTGDSNAELNAVFDQPFKPYDPPPASGDAGPEDEAMTPYAVFREERP